MDRYLFGLVGYPLGHSLSPVLHLAALESVGLVGEYKLYPISPGEGQITQLEGLLVQMRSGEIQGLNVTIPYKQTVIPFLDYLTDTAAEIGAVNTIYRDGELLGGENTDAPGFYQDLEAVTYQETGKTLTSGICVLLGAGGAARAIAYSLLNKGWQLRVAARRVEQAKKLVAEIGQSKKMIEAISWPPKPTELEDVTLIVNATPVGMHPDIEQSPWPKELGFPPNAVVYDLVYNPPETTLVREAHSDGLAAETGLGMLVHQAALAFFCWTGLHPSVEAMFDAASNVQKVKGK